MGLRFFRRSGWLDSPEMDTNPQESAKPDIRALRVRALIVILTLVFIAAPFVAYVIFGKGARPGQ